MSEADFYLRGTVVVTAICLVLLHLLTRERV